MRVEPRRPADDRGSKLALLAMLLSFAVSAPQSAAQSRAIDLALDRTVAGLGSHPSPVATPVLLEAARRASKSDDSGERGAALLVLGLARKAEDFERLAEASTHPDPELRHRAIVALGLHGSAPAYNELARRLEASARETDPQSNSDSERAVLAIALGFGGEQSSTSALKLHALQILRRSRERHVEELAACLIGIPAEEGRSVFEQVLSLPTFCPPTSAVSRSAVVNDATITRIATSAMAQRFANHNEWNMVRAGLLNDNDDSRRRLTCIGLVERGGDGLDERLKAKIARDLEGTINDRDRAVSSLALLALAHFDASRALSRARRIVDADTRDPRALDAAFLVLGSHGDARDERRLERWQARNRTPDAHAAWVLAVAELARRLEPSAFPPTLDATPRFPIHALRAGLTETNSQHPLVRTAHVVALARLGDAESSKAIRAMYFAYARTEHARTLATAAAHLDASALDARESAAPEPSGILGQSFIGTPRLWKSLEEVLDHPATDARLREAVFRMSAIAMAGRRGDFARRFAERAGPVSLPPTLARIAEWLDPRATLAMMSEH